MKSTINECIVFSGLLLMVLGWSCAKDTELPEPAGADYSRGVFVINEGNYGSGSGTLTFIKRDGTGLQQKVFQQTNNLIPLGNVVQSMNVIGDSAFVVVNNSNRIVVCNKYTLREVTSLENIPQPRYLVPLSQGRFAVSCWDNTVKIFDTRSLTQVDEMATGSGPEKMLFAEDVLWILNTGGLSVDSTITRVNLENGEVQTRVVYPRPTGIQHDWDGNIWVMCSGRKSYHPGGFSPSHLIRISPESLTITADLLIQQEEHDAIGLAVNEPGDRLYYLFRGAIYQADIDDPQPPHQPLADPPGTLYSMGYDPYGQVLYGADALDYTQSGQVYKFDAVTGAVVLQFKAGIIPGGFYFTTP